MEATVLNRNFESVFVLDEFRSFIWTDRYYEGGDFQVAVAANIDLLEFLKEDNYLYNKESDHLMIIEEISIDTNPETGDEFLVRGRSLETMLERRVFWQQQNFSGAFQAQTQRMLNLNIINPSIAARKIPNFIFQTSTDAAITGLANIDVQYTGDNIYTSFVQLAKDRSIGWKVVLDDQNRFVFSWYAGKDRSYEQSVNPYVVFSPRYENIVNSRYLESKQNYKNIALIGGEGEGSARTYETYTLESKSGLDRRELFVDARDLSSRVQNEGGGETVLPASQYKQMLQARGADKLTDIENSEIKQFEGEVETTQMYMYNRDFFMGDLVEIEDEYGVTACARITEMVMSHDPTGEKKVPGFEII